MTFNNKTFLSDMGLLFVTLIWGYGFIATKVAVTHYTSGQTTFYRFLSAVIVVLIIFRKKFKDVTKKDLFNCFVLGLFLYLGFIFQTVAINYTTIAKNAFLTTLNIIIVPIILAFAHRKRPDNYSIAGCLFAITGTGILSLNSDLSINFGDLLSIICAVFFSFHIICLERFVKETKEPVLVTGQLAVATVFSFLQVLFTGELVLKGFNASGIMGILYLGIFSTSFCLFMQAICQKHTTAVKAVIIFAMEAVFASIFAVLIYHEAVTARFLLGSSSILTGVIVSTTKLAFVHKAFGKPAPNES